MNPKQFKKFLESNERATAAAIEKTVNGKIESMRQDLEQHNIKHEADMAEIKPIIEAYKGTKVMGEAMKWISSVGLAGWGLWMAMKGITKP